MTPVPLPSKNLREFPRNVRHHGDIPEPKFDPRIHLNLSKPDYIKVFPDLKKKLTSCKGPKVKDTSGSRFGYSAPFQLLSPAGVAVVKQIVEREKHTCFSGARGSKRSLRGLYYSSPFIRDLQNCPELLRIFGEMIGEPVLPHANYSSSPQINLSTPGSKSPVDHWHVDSVSYVGVVIISDMTHMKGGDLEVFMGTKEEGYKTLEEKGLQGFEENIETVSYEETGKMILAQGSEIFHHVTPVTTDTVRTSLIFGLTPANAFQPPRTILDTMRTVDFDTGISDYEYFREKAWQLSHVLAHLAKKTPFTRDGKELARKMNPVIKELRRAVSILDSAQTDAIQFYDEDKGTTKKDENDSFGFIAQKVRG